MPCAVCAICLGWAIVSHATTTDVWSHELVGEREDGQTMAEYAVVLALLTITIAAVFTALSGGVANAMTTVTGIV